MSQATTDDTITALDVFGKEHQVAVASLTWRPSVYAIVIEDNKLLVSRQFKTKFDLPGGGVDLGEGVEEAVVRETKEETGIDVEVIKLAGVKTSIFFSESPSRGTQDAYHSILLYYVCKKVGGELSTDGFDEDEKQYAEVAEWVSLDKLDELELASTVDYRDIIRSCF
jgi:ADP-ribose pyrophosphatase YjhB (NUDIX family)